jgi:hypothetical protein
MNKRLGLISISLSAAILMWAAGGAPGGQKGPKPLPWTELAQMDYNTGKYPAALGDKFAAKETLVAGYVVPVEITDFDHITEFLLVPAQFGCCQGPPPNPNQIIEVKLTDAMPFDKLMGVVQLTGKLGIIKGTTGEFSFTLIKARITPPEYDT